MPKQILSVSLDPEIAAFWGEAVASLGMTRSGWLNQALHTWRRTGQEPLSIFEDSIEQPAVTPLHAARAAVSAAKTAYDRAANGPRLPPAEFARIKKTYYSAVDTLARLERGE